MSSLPLINWLISLFEYSVNSISSNPSKNKEILISDDDHFLLILSAVIDLINNKCSKDKIKKHIIIEHLQQINFEFKDIRTLKNTIDAIAIHQQNMTICQYINRYYQFICTLLSHLQSITTIKIDKPLIISHLISNKFNYITFSSKKKNDFIDILVHNCNINKSHATQLYEKITKIQTSKFILETNSKDQNVYSFGTQFWYSEWRNSFSNRECINIEPHFNNFKDEVTDSNGKIVLSIDRWNSEREKAINNQNKEECKEYCVTTRSAIAFKIPSNTLISIEHLMALQIYCNHRTAQRSFSETYRIQQIGENDDEIEYEHKYYANWGRLLYEAVNVFGNRPWTNKYFYHGIDNEMLFTKTIFIYNYAPLSTTLDKNIAINKFSNENGMVIQLDGSMNNCFDCKWISNFPSEKEFLFIGSIKPFKIDNVWLYRNDWIGLEKYMKAINNIIISVTDDNEPEIEQIKNKLLTFGSELQGLSLEELHNNLDGFTYEIAMEIDKDNQYSLSAVAWIVKLFHCYLSQHQ